MAAGRKGGPLAGFRVLEMAGLGPVPLAGLMLDEMGADVIRIERLSSNRAFLTIPEKFDLDRHGRAAIRLDLKDPRAVELVLRMVEKADALVEGFRPGVMERLGLGPDVALTRNPALVYGRMTGFGQDGPLADRAGHDLTYLALTGVLHAIGRKGARPTPPLNLVADFGGGTMFLIAGVLAALLERSRSGEGQVVDAAMIDGASMLASPFFSFLATGFWNEARGSNLLDSGAPFYDTYETSDGGHVAVACLEPQFFAEFARLLPLPGRLAKAQYDQSHWNDMRTEIAARFATRPRDQWAKLFERTDACVAPVLTFSEAAAYPHNRFRNTHTDAATGMVRPRPAPRFGRTPSAVARPGNLNAATTLADMGFTDNEIDDLVSRGIVER